MKRQVVTLEDGRTLIYYTFDEAGDAAAAADGASGED